jgi:hypothetical protein
VSAESRRTAGLVIVLLPTVIFGGASLLSLILGRAPGYLDNPLRQDLWRAGHAHAGVLLLLTLIALRYVDEAALSERLKAAVRGLIPAAAVLLPAAFFLSVLSPNAAQPNALIYLAYLGALFLAGGLLILGTGLLRAPGERGRGS